MKLTEILFKQHLGRLTRRIWYDQGKRTPLEYAAEKVLAARGLPVEDAVDVVAPKREKIDFTQFNIPVTQEHPEDETHPDWKDRPCFLLRDNDLLVEGLPQAQILTKTVVFKNVLPDSVEQSTKDVTGNIHELVKRIIKTSCIFDAHQELLPKIKDPVRYWWNFPRAMGITDVRKISNLSKKLLQLCDCISGPQVASSRSVIDSALIRVPFEKELDLYEFSLTMDVALMSEQPLRPGSQLNLQDQINMALPNIYPIHYSAGVASNNIYKFNDIFPLVSGYHKKNLHTVFIFNDSTKVKNLTELEIEEKQILGRALLKAFTAAAGSARQKFGNDVKELPEPITIQCIHSDGKAFYFSVYQLNTLDLDNDSGTKNYSWIMPKMNFYEKAEYVEGIPTLEGYNPEVFERILAFYKNN